MARFENLTVDELDVLRSALSGDDRQVNGDMRAFLLGQVEQQLGVKRENEQMRSDADDADNGSEEKPKDNPLSR